jgi:hypothetical protein
MKKVALLLVLSLCGIFIFAHEPGESIPLKKHQIEGKVIDSRTGEALVGVAVKIKGQDNKIYTDLKGYFMIEDIAPGTYNIDINYVSYKGITLKEIHASTSEVKIKVELDSVTTN